MATGAPAAVGQANSGDGVVHRPPIGPLHPPAEAGAGESSGRHDLPDGRRDGAGRLLALRHVPDPTAVPQLPAEKFDLAAEAFAQTENPLDQRRLARAVRTYQRHHLAPLHDEVGLDRHLPAVTEAAVRHPDNEVAHWCTI